MRSELRESSVMNRLWSMIGRGGGVSEDAPVSVLLHVFAGQEVVVALCADLKLRFWSIQVRARGQERRCRVAIADTLRLYQTELLA